MKNYDAIQVIQQPITVIIIEDKNDLYTYSAMLATYTKKVREIYSYIREINIAIEMLKKKYKNFPQELLRLVENKFYLYNVAKIYRTPQEVKNALIDIKEIEDQNKLLFLVDYKYEGEAENGIDLVKFLLSEGFRSSKFVLFTSQGPINFSFLSILKESGFDGYMLKSKDLEPWDLGLFLNKVMDTYQFLIEDKTYAHLIKNISNKLTHEEIKFLELLAAAKNNVEIAVLNPYQDQDFQKVSELSIRENIRLRKKASNIYALYKENIKKKLNAESTRNIVILKAALPYLSEKAKEDFFKNYFNDDTAID